MLVVTYLPIHHTSYQRQYIIARATARQAGEISKKLVFDVLKYRELVGDDVKFEQEQTWTEGDCLTLAELSLNASSINKTVDKSADN